MRKCAKIHYIEFPIILRHLTLRTQSENTQLMTKSLAKSPIQIRSPTLWTACGLHSP